MAGKRAPPPTIMGKVGSMRTFSPAVSSSTQWSGDLRKLPVTGGPKGKPCQGTLPAGVISN